MAPPTANYYGFNFTDAKLQYNNAGTLAELDVLYANKFDIKSDDETITFEGDGQKRNVYLMSALTVELAPDAINAVAIGTAFAKTLVTTGVPNSGSNLVWFGEVAEANGITAGFRAIGSAIKSVAGVESTVNLNLWVPKGTATVGAPGTVENLKKWGAQVLKLGAVRTTVDCSGAALPTVPSGGAFYAIYET